MKRLEFTLYEIIILIQKHEIFENSCKSCQHIAMSVIFDACLGRASIKTPKVRYISLLLKMYKSLDI